MGVSDHDATKINSLNQDEFFKKDESRKILRNNLNGAICKETGKQTTTIRPPVNNINTSTSNANLRFNQTIPTTTQIPLQPADIKNSLLKHKKERNCKEQKKKEEEEDYSKIEHENNEIALDTLLLCKLVFNLLIVTETPRTRTNITLMSQTDLFTYNELSFNLNQLSFPAENVYER